MSDAPRDPDLDDDDLDDDATARLPQSDRAGSPAFRPTGSAPESPTGAAGSDRGRPPFAPLGGEPTSGGPAADLGGGSASSVASGGSAVGAGGSTVGAGGPTAGTSPAGGDAAAVGPGTGGSRPAWRRMATVGEGPPTSAARQRRRRQWFVAGISIGAALIVIALCAGALAVVDTVSDVRESASDARDSRDLRDQSCLELERRLNRLNPPGAATTPAGRAVAVRDENSAVRIYVGEIGDPRAQDGWRQILDARAVYADALDRQAKSRAPAFYVPPRNADDAPIADDLIAGAPAPCAGPIRRLAAPDL